VAPSPPAAPRPPQVRDRRPRARGTRRMSTWPALQAGAAAVALALLCVDRLRVRIDNAARGATAAAPGRWRHRVRRAGARRAGDRAWAVVGGRRRRCRVLLDARGCAEDVDARVVPYLPTSTAPLLSKRTWIAVAAEPSVRQRLVFEPDPVQLASISSGFPGSAWRGRAPRPPIPWPFAPAGTLATLSRRRAPRTGPRSLRCLRRLGGNCSHRPGEQGRR